MCEDEIELAQTIDPASRPRYYYTRANARRTDMDASPIFFIYTSSPIITTLPWAPFVMTLIRRTKTKTMVVKGGKFDTEKKNMNTGAQTQRSFIWARFPS